MPGNWLGVGDDRHRIGIQVQSLSISAGPSTDGNGIARIASPVGNGQGAGCLPVARARRRPVSGC